MDLYLSNNDLALPVRLTASNDESILQHIRIRLRTFLGEWFLDQRVGIPYFEEVFIKNPSSNVVKSLIRRVLLRTPGVVTVSSVDFDIDSVTRKATIDFKVRIESGTILEESFTDLILV